MHNTEQVRIKADINNSGPSPTASTRLLVMMGPLMAPAVPPAAINANNRFACPWLYTSFIKLQNKETMNILNTLTQIKNARVVHGERSSTLNKKKKITR